MRIPPPVKRIDVEDAWDHIQRGMTASAYARQEGHSASAVVVAIHRAGYPSIRRPSAQRDAVDRSLYRVWVSLRSRCNSPKNPLYPNCGALGIRVSRAWDDFSAFRDWSRANGYKPGMAILRRVPSRGFSPGNCRWVTLSEVLQVGSARGTKAAFRRAAKRIPWKRVHDLYVRDGHEVAEVVRRLGVSRRGLERGLHKRGWKRARKLADVAGREPALWNAWKRMRALCRPGVVSGTSKLSQRIHRAWPDFDSFHAWSLESSFRKGLVLTRLDRTRPFGPKNCEWMLPNTSLEFHRPTAVTRNARWSIPAFGEKKSAADWSRDSRCAVSLTGLLIRLRGGWSAEDAIKTPPMNRNGRPERAATIKAFGKVASIPAWAADRRARVSQATIVRRLAAGMTPEAAITTPPYRWNR